MNIKDLKDDIVDVRTPEPRNVADLGDDIASVAPPVAPKAPEDRHDLEHFGNAVKEGLINSADEFSTTPLPTIAYNHVVKPGVDAYHEARANGENMIMAGLAGAKASTGALASGAVGNVMPHLMPVEAYFHSRANGSSPEDAIRDAAHVGMLLAATHGVGQTAGLAADAAGYAGKKAANAFANVSPQTVDRYMARSAEVNAAPDLGGITKEFLADAQNRAKQGSADSTASYNTLKAAGTTPLATFTQPLEGAIQHIKDMGVGSKSQVGAIGMIQDQIEALKQYADESGNIPLDKGKALIGELRNSAENLDGKVSAQTSRGLTDAIRTIDQGLKTTSPEYAAQMQQLAANTKAATAVTDRFNTPEGAMNTLQQIQRGNPKAEFKAEDLQNYDRQFGTDFSNKLQDSYAKQQFMKDSTAGSKKTTPFALTGGQIGGTVGGPAGVAIGSAAGYATGALADKYGGQAVKAALDVGIKIHKLGKYSDAIMSAAQKGGNSLAVTHYLLSQKDPGYQATQKDDENGNY